MGTVEGPPDSVLHKIDQAYHGLEKALNYLAATFLFALMLLACSEVVARKLFNSPIHGQADLVEIAIPTMGFFGLAYCQRMAALGFYLALMTKKRCRSVFVDKRIRNTRLFE